MVGAVLEIPRPSLTNAGTVELIFTRLIMTENPGKHRVEGSNTNIETNDPTRHGDRNGHVGAKVLIRLHGVEGYEPSKNRETNANDQASQGILSTVEASCSGTQDSVF